MKEEPRGICNHSQHAIAIATAKSIHTCQSGAEGSHLHLQTHDRVRTDDMKRAKGEKSPDKSFFFLE